jgi:hypothetical protein
MSGHITSIEYRVYVLELTQAQDSSLPIHRLIYTGHFFPEEDDAEDWIKFVGDRNVTYTVIKAIHKS